MRAAIEAFLTEREIDFAHKDGTYGFVLPGSKKLSIGVGFSASTNGLRAESFFMRAPLEHADDVFRLLLSRNTRSRLAWFAIDSHDDAYLLGFLPRQAVTGQALDELLGEIVTTSDEMFDAVLARGFEEYLARDLRWRASQQPNP